MSNSEKLDCIICLDTTGSMGNFCSSIGESVPEIVQILSLTNVFNRMKVVTYEDYGDGDRLYRQTDWHTQMNSELLCFVLSLRAGGGEDGEEAQKTAFNRIFNDTNNPTIVFHFTDAPPHSLTDNGHKNFTLEKNAHMQNQWEFDWVKLSDKLASKNITFYNIIYCGGTRIPIYYLLLSDRTGGKTILLTDNSKKNITKTTINLCMSLMGQPSEFSSAYQLELEFPFRISEESKIDFNRKVERRPISIEPHSSMNINMRERILQFRNNKEFSDFVFDIFDDLISWKKIASLTTNNVFGQMWREICKRRDDVRREKLLFKLDEALRDLEKLDKTLYAKVRDWLNDSYDQTEDVKEEILKAPSQTPCLILRNNNKYTPKEIIEISRSCNSHIMKIISSLVTELELVNDENNLPISNDVPMYIPLSLPVDRIFALLPHLMAPGCMFSNRTAITMAMIVSLTNIVILSKEARQFLEEQRGKWYDEEIPENFSAGFIKLALQVQEFLTLKEREIYNKLFKFIGLMSNGKTSITLKIPYIANKTKRLDDKVKCSTCNIMRSPSLLVPSSSESKERGEKDEGEEENKCVFCFWKYENAKEPCGDNESIWCECRTCHSHYAVVMPELLNVTPKCYFCRELKNGKDFSVKCNSCHNHFIVPKGEPSSSEYICAQCKVDPSKCFEEVETTIQEIFDSDRKSVLDCIGMKIDDDINPYGGNSTFKVKNKIDNKEKENVKFSYKGKEVMNSDEVNESIYNWVTSGKSEFGYCMMCFEDKPKNTLISVCGHRKCKSVACSDCIGAWYGLTKPGHIVFTSHLCCPFCKCNPVPSIYRKFNPSVMSLIKDSKSMDIHWYYGWCLKCYKLKEAIECVCAADLPDISNFTCEGCNSTPMEGKPCPGCGIEVIKTSGCNHMECPVEECKIHWCYVCGYKASNSGDVYGHMHREHGGYFDNWLNGEREDYESDDDYYSD